MVGPLLVGLQKSAQIIPIGSTVSAIVNLAAIAAHGSIEKETNKTVVLRRS